MQVASSGIVVTTMAAEYATATPAGPYGRPTKYATIIAGAMTNAIFTLRPNRPRDIRNEENGFRSAKARIVGVNNRKIWIAPTHFGPKRSMTISSAKSAQLKAIGKVNDMRREYPFRK